MFNISKLAFLFILFTAFVWGSNKNTELDLLIKSAQKNDNVHKIILAEKNKMNLMVKSVNTTYFPQINLNGTMKYQSLLPTLKLNNPGLQIPEKEIGIKDQYDINVEFKEMIFNGFTRTNSIKLYKNKSKEQTYRAKFRKNEIANIILQMVYQHKLLGISIKSLLTSKERLKINFERVKLFYDQGFMSALDTLEIAAHINEIDLNLLNLNVMLEQIVISLQNITSISQIDSIIIPENFLSLNIFKDISSLSAEISNNFDISLMNYKKTNLNLIKKIHKADYYPTVAAFGSYHYGKPGINFFGEEWEKFWLGGISLNINLWNWNKTKKQIDMDNLSIKQINLKKLQLEKNKRAHLKQMWIKIQGLLQKRIIADKNLKQKNDKYKLINKQWNEGQISTNDVLEAEQELTKAELLTKEIKFEYLSLYQKILLEINMFEYKSN